MKKETIPVDKWLKVTNQADDSMTIDIEGTIGWDEADWPHIKQQLIDIVSKAQKKLLVNIYSLGGYVADGLMIHDALKMTKAKVTTRAMSFVASAATVVAQAGDTRQMSRNGLYLIHKSSNIAWGNANEIGVVVQDLNTIDERIMELYANRSKVDKEVIRGLMNENNGTGKWLSADEALQYGLIDEILEPSKAAAHFNPEFLIKNNLPPIPEEIMTNLNAMNENLNPKKGIMQKFADFLASVGFKMEADEPEADLTDDPIIEDPVPVADPAPSDPEPEPDPVQADPVPDPEPEPENKNPELDILKLQNQQLQTQIDDLKATLSDAQSKLAQAGAGSTRPDGPIGREDPDMTVDEKTKSWNNDINKIVDMFTFGTLANKKSKIPKE